MNNLQVLSCIQPSGELHIGNYLGAVRNWVSLQKEFNCTFGIANYHPMTIPYNPEGLKKNSINMAIDLIACGVKVENLFLQSLVPEHTELNWILGCVTSYGDLTRQTQWKSKSKDIPIKTKKGIRSAGLFTYPVLQAADILLYKADYVPVGKDQVQHLELANTAAVRFNSQYGVNYFPIPKPLLSETPKVMSPYDPSMKMSKSYSDKHWIGLMDDEKSVHHKIRTARTESTFSETMSPGVANLFTLLEAFGGPGVSKPFIDAYNQESLRFSDLKESVAEAIISKTKPIREKRAELQFLKDQVFEDLNRSSNQIRKKAKTTLAEVKEIVGLY